MGRVRKALFGISPRETDPERRGFRNGNPAVLDRLARIGESFVEGYNYALEDSRVVELSQRLDRVSAEYRGWAYEGAAMALALFDRLTPWKRDRFRGLLEGPGAAHAYMLHVGAGWAYARLHKRMAEPPAYLDPLLGWLALDGYGFHEGFFHTEKYYREHARPARISNYGLRAFDQGLGRCLWFVEGALAERISESVANFSSERHVDLWSGVGLAAAYAGGVEREELLALRGAAGTHLAALAQGVAFAAKARQRAGNPTSYTEMACQVIWGASADEAARATDAALEHRTREGTARGVVASEGHEPDYETWRRCIQSSFAGSGRTE